MRITNKKKFIRGVLIIIAILSLFICKSTFSYSKQNYKTIYVSSNETLWEIAKSETINNDYYKNKDIREVVDSIKTINNLKNSNLYEGQKLLIEIN